MTDKYQFSYHLSVKTQSYKCWTLSIKTWVAIIKESATNCVYDASEGTGVGIVYLVGKEQDSLPPPQVLLESLAFVGWFHQIQCLQVTYAKAKFINLDANNETKKGIKRWHFWKVYFSLESLYRKLYLERKKLVLYLYPLIKLLQVLLPTLHIYFISNVHSDEHSAQEGISLLDFNYLILILLAQPLTNIVFLAPLGVKFVLLEH